MENQLGTNIRSLRIAWGETQEQLGEVIHVEKNTVSNYETGKREPDNETLTAIAKHYMVSVEDLWHGDFTSIGKITADPYAFWKNIDIILPIVSSDKAMQNEDFKRAFDAHRIFYNQLHLVNLDGFENMGICADGYLSAIDEDGIEAEAAANFIALWYLSTMLMKNGPEVTKTQPAALRQVAARDKKARKAIESIDPSFESDAIAILSEIDDDMKEMVSEMLTLIKESREWSDLA